MRVGLVGSGVMGKIHAAAWKKTPAQLVGVVSADAESAQALAADSGATAPHRARRMRALFLQ